MSDFGGAGRKAAYAEYLKSDHWKTLKVQKALVEPRQCVACPEKKVQLHHMLYRELFEETRLEDTCWLCRECHRTFHLRAGVKINTKRSVEWIRQETIRIIQFNVKKRQNQKLTKRERRRIKTEMRREAKRLRREKHEARCRKRDEEIHSGLRKAKIPKPGSLREQLRKEFNVAVSSIKPRSALNSTMAGKIVAVKPS
jgi:hypothetical protein